MTWDQEVQAEWLRRTEAGENLNLYDMLVARANELIEEPRDDGPDYFPESILRRL